MHKIPANEPMLNAPPNIVHGKRFVTATENFVVPDGVYMVWLTATAPGNTGGAGAGGGGGGGTGGNAGNFVLYQPIPVAPGQIILCTPSALTFGLYALTTLTGATGTVSPGAGPGAGVGGAGASSIFGGGGAGGVYSSPNGGNGSGGAGYGSGGGGGGGSDNTGGGGGGGGPGAMLIEW